MMTGKFFIPEFLNNEDSYTDIFRYSFIHERDINTKLKRYPIYVAFKKHSIEFHYQGSIVMNKVGLENQVSTNLENSFKDEAIFGQFSILKIPIGTSNYKNTFETIKSCFSKELKIKFGNYNTVSSSSNDLVPNTSNNAVSNNSNNPVPDTSTNTVPNNSNDSVLNKSIYSYSQLNIFGLNEEFNFEDMEDKFFRKILLDFIDDFFNSNVFNLSSKYYFTKEAILDSFILKGIYLKADFYTKAELFRLSPNDDLYKVSYFKALDLWTTFITDINYKKLFAKNKKGDGKTDWFDFLDVEITEPLFKKFFINQNIKLKNKTINKETPENNLDSIRQNIIKKCINSSIINYEIAKATGIAFIDIVHTIRSETSIKNVKKNFLLFLLILLIPISLYLSIISFFNNPILFLFGIATTIAIPFIYVISSKILKKGNIKHDEFRNFIQIIILISPILIFFLIFNYQDYIYFYNPWGWFINLITIPVLCSIFFVIYSYFFAPAINLLLPRLLMAIITSWIAILSSLDYWKNTFDLLINDSFWFGFWLIFFTACFLLFEISRNTGIRDKHKLLWKSLNIIIPGLLLSLTSGLIGMYLLSGRTMTHSDFFDTKIVKNNIYQVDSLENLKEDLIKRKINIEKTLLYKEIELRHWNTLGNFIQTSITCPNIEFIEKDIRKTFNYVKSINDSLALIENLKLNPDSIYVNLIAEDSNKAYKLRNKDKSKSAQRVIYPVRISCSNKYIEVIPGFLILMSSFALFSGIFLTLLFDDKPVTEII